MSGRTCGWTTYLKAGETGRVASKAVVIAVGVNGQGRRDVFGLAVGPAETEAFWTDFLRALTRRGLTGVRLVISDAHLGLKRAAAKVLSAGWQRCRVHFMRNALAHVPRRQHQMVAAVIRVAFVQETQAQASAQWRETADKLRERFPRLAELMDEAESDVLAFMAFPKEHWPQLASTNPLERLNKEIKRRAWVIGIFPNDAATIRLVGALLEEQTDEWQVTRRYMSGETLGRATNPKMDAHALLETKKATGMKGRRSGFTPLDGTQPLKKRREPIFLKSMLLPFLSFRRPEETESEFSVLNQLRKTLIIRQKTLDQ